MQLVLITWKEQYQFDKVPKMTPKHLSESKMYSLTRPAGKSFPQRLGSVAEWSKALVLGTSLQGGVGSNPTTANFATQQSVVLWCSGYHICLTRRRSPVRNRAAPPLIFS